MEENIREEKKKHYQGHIVSTSCRGTEHITLSVWLRCQMQSNSSLIEPYMMGMIKITLLAVGYSPSIWFLAGVK